MTPSLELLNFYRTHSPFTRSDLLKVEPHWTLSELASIAQNQLIHYGWMGSYQVTPGSEASGQINARFVDRLLQQRQQAGFELQDRTRPAERHLGCCRDFSLLTTALLREQGVPARNRVGFAGYFTRGHWHDHVVTEWWDGGRWVRSDAQLDPFQQEVLQLNFDPLDLSETSLYLTAAQAWLAYRAGEVDPDRFGVAPESPYRGPSFIRGNLLHELYSLNRTELLLWEGPAEFWRDVEDLSPAELADMDRLARDLSGEPETLETLQGWMKGFGFQEVVCRAPNGFEETWGLPQG